MSAPWPTLQFDEAVEDASGGNIKTKQNDYAEVGEFPIVDQGKALIAGYTDDEAALCKVPLPVVIFGDHTRCLKFVDFPFGMGADGVKVLKPKAGLDANFLYHYLRQIKLPDGGYDRHFKYLKRETVPLPPLEEQRRIAAILDQAETLRTHRRTALALLDSLTQSLFLDMFGDPVANPKGWPIQTLDEVTTKVTDGEHLNPAFTEVGMPIVMAGNVLDDRIDLDAAKRVGEPLGMQFRKKCGPELGDLLIVGRGATIGRLCRVNVEETFCLMGSVILVKPDRTLLDERFLSGMLALPSMHAQLYKSSGSSAQQAIYLKDVKKLTCLLPPLTLQQTFATRIQAIEALKTTHRTALAQLDALFASLQQRAFAGEL